MAYNFSFWQGGEPQNVHEHFVGVEVFKDDKTFDLHSFVLDLVKESL